MAKQVAKTREEKPPVIALKDAITWEGKFGDRKVFKKEQIIELIKQFMTDQRDADIAWCESQIQQVQDEVIEDLVNALRDPIHPLHQKVLHHIEEAIQQAKAEERARIFNELPASDLIKVAQQDVATEIITALEQGAATPNCQCGCWQHLKDKFIKPQG